MKQSELIGETRRDSPKDELSLNSQLLIRAGYISRLMAGVYSFLPLGKRVLDNIEGIVREEMNFLGSQEVFLPALQPKGIWDTTGRWNSVDVLFKLQGGGDRELCLGPTHEEVVTPLIGNLIKSYKDLPKSVYQLQTKFRNEARPKSGLLRGREFRMKDMYSFHTSEADLDIYYEKTTEAYKRIFAKCGLGEKTFLTYASGGAFSRYSHEFQTLTEHGEDSIHLWRDNEVAVNREIFDEVKILPEWKDAQFEQQKSIEVGNIFKLGTRFSDAFGLSYKDSTGKNLPVHMGCYGLGTSRLMGSIVEVLSDANGLVWPDEIAPYRVHIVPLGTDDKVTVAVNECEEFLEKGGLSFLTDDREISAGQKFKDSDLIGIPIRIVVSDKTISGDTLEIKERRTGRVTKVTRGALQGYFHRS